MSTELAATGTELVGDERVATSTSGLPGSTSRFERVVGILEELWRADHTRDITRIAVACTIRELLPDHVPVSRGDGDGGPAVVVNDSIGVVVADDPDLAPLSRRLRAATDRVEKLVVYATTRAMDAIDDWPRVRSLDTGATELPVVDGGVRAEPAITPGP